MTLSRSGRFLTALLLSSTTLLPGVALAQGEGSGKVDSSQGRSPEDRDSEDRSSEPSKDGEGALADSGGGDGSSSGGVLETATGLDSDNLHVPLRALAMVTIFGVVPSIILLTTCFPRILVVLSFLRRALGAQDLPPNLVVFGLSLLLTGVVMTPIWKNVYEEAYVPLVDTKEITADEAYRRAELPVKRFLLTHTLRSDLLLMLDVAERAPRSSAESADTKEAESTVESEVSLADKPLEDLSLFTILPAFVLSELKLAFQMGFLLFLPFLLIDLVVSAVLVSMGMIMLPPALVSLPLKILVFVLVDGWSLVVGQLLYGFQV